MRVSQQLRFAVAVAATLAFGLGAFSTGVRASTPDDQKHLSFEDAVGSWFGRAVPVPGETICPVGPGCPVPPEIVMIFTVAGDGTFIGIDSNIFVGGTHSTAHGQWTRKGPQSIKSEFTLLQSDANGIFIGGFKNLFNATVVGRDEMVGGIDAYLYSYTDAAGHAIVDADGLPTPSPLAPASACATTAGCTHLGKFSFKVRRVQVH
jgi:hypothetical protein